LLLALEISFSFNGKISMKWLSKFVSLCSQLTADHYARVVTIMAFAIVFLALLK